MQELQRKILEILLCAVGIIKKEQPIVLMDMNTPKKTQKYVKENGAHVRRAIDQNSQNILRDIMKNERASSRCPNENRDVSSKAE